MFFALLSLLFSIAVNTTAILRYMRIPAALKTQPRKGTSEDRLRLWLKVCEWPIADNYAVNIGVGALLQIVETVGDTDLDVSIDEIVGVEIPGSQIKRIPIGLVNPGQKFAQSRIGIPAVVVTHLEMQRLTLDISLIGQQIDTDDMPRSERTDFHSLVNKFTDDCIVYPFGCRIAHRLQFHRSPFRLRLQLSK